MPVDDDLVEKLRREVSVPLWPTAGRACGIGRNSAYKAAERGEIPTNKFGGKLTVPTAPLRRLLGIYDGAARRARRPWRASAATTGSAVPSFTLK